MSPQDGSCQKLRNYVYICWSYAEKLSTFFRDTVHVGFVATVYQIKNYNSNKMCIILQFPFTTNQNASFQRANFKKRSRDKGAPSSTHAMRMGGDTVLHLAALLFQPTPQTYRSQSIFTVRCYA